MAKDVIIACDFSSGDETLAFLDQFKNMDPPYVKIGMELFYAEGSDIIRRIKERGSRIFLDLKLHDIPNTVQKTMSVLSGLGVDMINVHAQGGSQMMSCALKGLTQRGSSQSDACHDDRSKGDMFHRPLLIAVTILTSINEEMLKNELLISDSMEQVVSSFASNAKASGLDGVVCSPLEAGLIHSQLGQDFITVTPGVRLNGKGGDDQMRVTTPSEARALGSDYIVVGRPITRSADPVATYELCLREFVAD